MPECRVVPCYKMFLKELKEIMSISPLNISLSPPPELSPAIDVEHITISNRFSAHSTTMEAVNRGVQTNFRTDSRKDSPILAPKIINRQMVPTQKIRNYSK